MRGFYNIFPPFGICGVGGRFKAKLWLCEEHPLSLCEQVAPIIDLRAVSNALFAKLRGISLPCACLRDSPSRLVRPLLLFLLSCSGESGAS